MKDAYSMARVDEITDAIDEEKFFTTLDAESGYFQVAMNPKDLQKTACACSSGSYEFTKMPFVLVNGPAIYQRVMNQACSKVL